MRRKRRRQPRNEYSKSVFIFFTKWNRIERESLTKNSNRSTDVFWKRSIQYLKFVRWSTWGWESPRDEYARFLYDFHTWLCSACMHNFNRKIRKAAANLRLELILDSTKTNVWRCTCIILRRWVRIEVREFASTGIARMLSPIRTVCFCWVFRKAFHSQYDSTW